MSNSINLDESPLWQPFIVRPNGDRIFPSCNSLLTQLVRIDLTHMAALCP